MKQLFIILFFFTLGYFSACHPARNLVAYPPPSNNGKGYYVHELGGRCKCSKCVAANKYDTIPSKILISHDAPAFGQVRDGACLYRNGACTGKHLRLWHKRLIVVGPEYTVWGCKRVFTPNK
jgi:hypothetical protein